MIATPFVVPAAEGGRLTSRCESCDCASISRRKAGNRKPALQGHRKGEPRLAYEQDQAPMLLDTLKEIYHLAVRMTAVRILHLGPLSEQGVGLVKEQYRVVGL